MVMVVPLSFIPRVRSPQGMPDLRLWLLDVWKPGGMFSSLPMFRDAGLKHPRNFKGPGRRFDEWEYGQVRRASLWWVDEEMVELLFAVTPTIPEDVKPHELQVPSDSGIVLLAKPWMGMSADSPDIPVQVDAFVWGITSLPPIRAEFEPNGVLGVSLSAYQWIDQGDDGTGFYVPLGRSDWPVTDGLAEELCDGLRPTQWECFKEDRRVLAALFTLLAQPGLTDVEHRRPHRQVIRRQQRGGVALEDASAVRVVTLRRPPTERSSEPHEAQEGRWSHRWVVQPHTVLQPYGPGRSLRKLIIRGPFVKGPKDLPLILKEEVRAWRR